MENIYVITVNENDDQVEIKTTVDELIDAWGEDDNMPGEFDPVVSCWLGQTQLYFETFGELMRTLTGWS